MRKYRGIGGLAVMTPILGKHSSNRHGDPDEAVLIDSGPNDVEPC
jgi:hypothetical protein